MFAPASKTRAANPLIIRAFCAMAPIIVAVIVGSSPPAHAQTGDAWMGPDKWLHFGVSTGISGASYGAAAFAFEEAHHRALLAGAVALAAGAGKELYDATGRGHASAKDMVWNALGAATGALAGYAIQRLLRQPPARTNAALRQVPPAYRTDPALFLGASRGGRQNRAAATRAPPGHTGP